MGGDIGGHYEDWLQRVACVMLYNIDDDVDDVLSGPSLGQAEYLAQGEVGRRANGPTGQRAEGCLNLNKNVNESVSGYSMHNQKECNWQWKKLIKAQLSGCY